MVLLTDTYIVLIAGPQPCLHNQYGEAEGRAGFGRGKSGSFHLLLINCKHPVDHCHNLQVLEDPAEDIYKCDSSIFCPVLNSEPAHLGAI